MSTRVRWPLAYAVFAAIAGSLFIAANAPFQVPDEVGHYWRAAAMAEGTLAPAATDGPPSAMVPRGVKDLVAVMWVETAGRRGVEVGLERLRRAQTIELQRSDLVKVKFPAFYTPLPYAPQAAVLAVASRVGARPLPAFYAARFANLAVMVALLAAAMAIAPSSAWIFAAVGSLPMTLALGASLSPDAFTIGIASVALAVAITAARATPARYTSAVVAVALLLALCKPVYFLLPILAVWNRNVKPARRLALALAVVTAIAAGVAISAFAASRGAFDMRPGMGVDPRRQARVVLEGPVRFAGVALEDLRRNEARYRREIIGRLGWLDVGLPTGLNSIAQLLLLLGAVSAARVLTAAQRVLAVAILAAALLMIALSQYIVWTPVGADLIEGVQGRYFIPIVGLFAAAAQVREARRFHVAAVTMLFAALVLLDAIGIYRVGTRYF